MAGYEHVLSKFSGVRSTRNGWAAQCPVHESGAKRHKPSLWLKLGRTNNLICVCKRGCSTESVLAAVGLQWGDLFPEGTERKARKPMGKVVKAYDYRDERGELLFQSCRLEPKDFRQRRPDPARRGKWLWGLGGARLVLYRLPELVKARNRRRVLIVEGEKDCDALAKLGFLSTCNPLGCCKWTIESDEQYQFGKSLDGADVAIIGDNDPVDAHVGYSPGARHVDLVAEALKPWAARIRKLYALPGVGAKGDAYDWVAAGGTARQLSELINATPVWHECPPGLVEMRRAARRIAAGVDSLSPREWLRQSREELDKFNRQLFGATA